jgi:RNA polymerase sigma-70 factor (ECF subfamily)
MSEIEVLLERAHRAWPNLAVEEATFRAACARAGTAEVQAEDLWLALACAAGETNALRALDKLITPSLEKLIARQRDSKFDADDIKQLLWQRLLVGEVGRPPKIQEYSGRGELLSWLRVVATRLLVDAGRKRSGNEAAHFDEGAAEVLFADGVDPELDYLKRQYRSTFATAFTSLSAEDRNLLRQHLVEQLSVDALAVAHGVHRATAARRVQSAKATLLMETRRRLMAGLRLSRDELESVMRMIESQLHVSVLRLLA